MKRWYALILWLACAGCGDARDVPEGLGPSDADEPEPPEAAPKAPLPCAEGDERDCKIILPTIEGVSSCLAGIQIWVAGAWSPCQAPNEP